MKVGDELAKEYGVPVVNKRISVTPIAIAAAGCKNADSYVSIAQTLDQGSTGGWRKLHRRFFRAGAEGLYRK